MILDRNYAAVTRSRFTAITVPLSYFGLTSAKYTGTIILAIPTPSPTTILPAISTSSVGENAIIPAPAVNNKSATIITFFLPILSANGPANKLPNNAPS